MTAVLIVMPEQLDSIPYCFEAPDSMPVPDAKDTLDAMIRDWHTIDFSVVDWQSFEDYAEERGWTLARYMVCEEEV